MAKKEPAMKAITPKGFGAPLGMYSHGVVAAPGELVVVAGQVGMDAAGQVAAGDIVAQTKQAFENVRSVVQAGGCSMRDVVRLQTFLTRAGDIPGFMKARSEIFPAYFPDGVYPPNTLLVIHQLVRPELLVEIEAIAVRRKKARAAAPRKTASRRRRPRR
jgi:enamine deaminase RidA (YjgF/YER057c/UK114 family)